MCSPAGREWIPPATRAAIWQVRHASTVRQGTLGKDDTITVTPVAGRLVFFRLGPAQWCYLAIPLSDRRRPGALDEISTPERTIHVPQVISRHATTRPAQPSPARAQQHSSSLLPTLAETGTGIGMLFCTCPRRDAPLGPGGLSLPKKQGGLKLTCSIHSNLLEGTIMNWLSMCIAQKFCGSALLKRQVRSPQRVRLAVLRCARYAHPCPPCSCRRRPGPRLFHLRSCCSPIIPFTIHFSFRTRPSARRDPPSPTPLPPTSLIVIANYRPPVPSVATVPDTLLSQFWGLATFSVRIGD